MLTLQEISEKLVDRRLSVVAERTGLHENTIANIRDGRSENPAYTTLKALSDYFQEQAQ